MKIECGAPKYRVVVGFFFIINEVFMIKKKKGSIFLAVFFN